MGISRKFRHRIQWFARTVVLHPKSAPSPNSAIRQRVTEVGTLCTNYSTNSARTRVQNFGGVSTEISTLCTDICQPRVPIFRPVWSRRNRDWHALFVSINQECSHERYKYAGEYDFLHQTLLLFALLCRYNRGFFARRFFSCAIRDSLED